MNIGNLHDAEKYVKEALRHLDGMSERERYNQPQLLAPRLRLIHRVGDYANLRTFKLSDIRLDAPGHAHRDVVGEGNGLCFRAVELTGSRLVLGISRTPLHGCAFSLSDLLRSALR